MTQFGSLIRALAEGQVKFVLVGGVAATLHGSARLTQDVDAVYARDADNLKRIAHAADALIFRRSSRNRRVRLREQKAPPKRGWGGVRAA